MDLESCQGESGDSLCKRVGSVPVSFSCIPATQTYEEVLDFMKSVH